MTTRADFTEQEWNTVTLAPVNAGTYLMTADMSVVGAFKELRALAKAMEELAPPAAAEQLVKALHADLEEKSKREESVERPESGSGEDERARILGDLRETGVLLDAKCTPEEAAAFKQWLLDLAQAVANADKEGGHFGIGGVRVSEKEKAALAEMAEALGAA